ncbi:hypothetical protein GDO86_011907, partial [Hymenochirus boettgeri]
MTSEYVDAFQAALVNKYKESLSLGSDVLYTDVGLVKNRIDTETRKLLCKTTLKELVIYDLAEQEKEAVDPYNLFEDRGRKEMETKIIALLGQSGMGKSVLVKKICQDWTDGNYSLFSIVLCYKCSMLNSYKDPYSLKDFLFELSSCPQERNVEIYQYILRNPEKVLLIFDGVDEFHDSEGLMHTSYSASPTKTHKIKELFAGLLQKKLLRGCTILITARPRDKFNQYLTKVDQIVEMIGFSQKQVEWYITEYFKRLPHCNNIPKWIKDCEYLFRYCYIPLMCRLMCQFAEANCKIEMVKSHPSLASLLSAVLHKDQKVLDSTSERSVCNSTVHSFSVDGEILSKKKLDVNSGNSVFEHFRMACHILENIKDKSFANYVSLEPKKKKNHDVCPDMVRRYLVGLLFHKDKHMELNLLNVIAKKQVKITEYFRKVEISTLCPQKLLELCHCVYEIHDRNLILQIAEKLSGAVSFVGTRVTPPDVYVLRSIMKDSSRKIALDVRKTGIDQEGLKELVELDNITSFRASLDDTVRLWTSLKADNNYILLAQCVEKFTTDPFKAESIKDITDLLALVHIQNEICSCLQESTSGISEIPAIRTLKKVIFGLGKTHGQTGFMVLVDILPQLPTLQHLDLHYMTENHIGDKGVEKLAEKFPLLSSLETL